VKTLYIEPGSPLENGYIETINGKLRVELLACEQFDTLLEAKVGSIPGGASCPADRGKRARDSRAAHQLDNG
jgi:hypothetical protein